MDTSFEQKVRERAYRLWLDDGMAHGCAEDHWLRAEKALAAECAIAIPSSSTMAPAAARAKTGRPATKSKKAPARKTARH